MTPKFTHDCEGCKFLGHYEGHDLYYCAGEPTVIARYGSDGPAYASGLAFANAPLNEIPDNGIRHLLRTAWLLAKDMGVITKDAEKARIWHPTR